MSDPNETRGDGNVLYLIYTSGRVGSTTLFGTLKKALGEDKVFKVHRLTADGLAEYRRFRPIWTDDERVFERLDGRRDEFELKMITLTRDPFASEVSSLFHNLEVHFPGRSPLDFDLDELRDRLQNKKSSSSEGYFVRWFDIECKPYTGIDVYDRPFPKDQGYDIFSNGNVDLLVLRLEDIDRVFQPALADFLGLEIDELDLHHIGDEQPYAPLYKRFKKEIRFPAELLDRYYDTKYCRHFYTDAELARFRRRWQA